MGEAITLIKAINQAMHEEFERDPNVFILGEDIAEGGVFLTTEGLREKSRPRLQRFKRLVHRIQHDNQRSFVRRR